MKIVKATQNEMELLIEIWEKSNYAPTTKKKMKEVITRSFKFSDIYIVYDKSKPVSYFALTYKDKISYLNMIVIVEDSQGKGLGKKLMKEIFNLAKKNKSKFMQLAVFSKNFPAVVLYSKQGFYFVKFKKQIDKKLGRKVIMEKKL
jgi:ribosomal protein S18 acetylase RimI-like enzyme